MKTIAPSNVEEWLTWRSKGIGASDAAAVAGASKYRSRYQVWLQKTGQCGPQEETEAMRWGRRLEPLLVEAYEERTGIMIRRPSIQLRCEHANYSWMRATLDGINAEDAVIELKVAGLGTSRSLGEDGETDSLPVEWLLQVQHQLAVTGLSKADVVVFHPSLQLRIYPTVRDDDLIDALIESESEFWDLVCRQVPPTPETIGDYLDWAKRFGSKGSRIALDNDEAAEAATELRRIRADLKQLEQAESEAKYAIIRHLAGHEYGDLADGRIIRAQTVDIAERTQTVKAHTQLRISVKEPKE